MAIVAFLSGLAVFLYAMGQLESGIRQASGEGFKNWIVRGTKTPISSAFAGVLITAILQSSSMVSLLALAFVSAGVLSLYSGIGIVLGANVGTTFTGWIVTMLGFKMDLDSLIVPLLGVGALAKMEYLNSARLKGLGVTLFGFGLLIFGLSVMKESVAGLSEYVDLSASSGLYTWVYLLIGLILAAVMQSSSAVMMMTLAFLSSQSIQLVDAAALMIGADLGTTSTTILGSIGQSTVKKQLALAHVLFNIVVDVSAFLLLLPMLPQALHFVGITDPMIGLVSFHSVFNLLGLLIFLPVLSHYSRAIERLVPAPQDTRNTLLQVPVQVPDAALRSFVASVIMLARDAIELNLARVSLSQSRSISSISMRKKGVPIQQQYADIKRYESQLVGFAHRLQSTELNQTQQRSVNQLLESTRAIVYACKTLKDVQHDFDNMIISTDSAQSLAKLHQRFLAQFYRQYEVAVLSVEDLSERSLTRAKEDDSGTKVSMLASLQTELAELNGQHHQACSDLIVNDSRVVSSVSATVSTWFNLNHEIHHHARYMISALSRLERAVVGK